LRAQLLVAEQSLLALRQELAQSQAFHSASTLAASKKLGQVEARAQEAEQVAKEREAKVKQVEEQLQETTIELHDLMRIRNERKKGERLILACAASDAEGKGATSGIVREDDTVLEGLSREDLLTRYRSLRFSYDAHLNHAQELSHTLTLSFEKEIAALQKQMKTQDAQYAAAIAALREKHAAEVSSLSALHSKLKVEYESKEKTLWKEKQILESTMRKMGGQSVPGSPSSGPISSSHSLLLTEYQSLYTNYTSLQVSFSKAQASNEAYVAKLESAKKLVIALNNERKELLEYKQRKRKENEKLRLECKQFYHAYLQASNGSGAHFSSPLASPSSSRNNLASPQPNAANQKQIVEQAGLFSPGIARSLDRQTVDVSSPTSNGAHVNGVSQEGKSDADIKQGLQA
jgi:hypothetical protein